MQKAVTTTLLGNLLLAAAPAAAEPDVETLANSCAICHGTDGLSPGSIDSLADLSTDEFVEEMQEFKYEKGEGRIMGVIAKAYTDQQIRALARHFEALRR